MLTVIQRAGKDRNGIFWRCKCDCGSVCDIRGIHLRSGASKSCGCSFSRGEMFISQSLKALGVYFKKQYSFDDCLSNKGMKLRFDFGILNNKEQLLGLIEYQGIQHYQPVKHFGGDKAFERCKENDTIKLRYCQAKNIPLFYINYGKNVPAELVQYIVQKFNKIQFEEVA